jgi:hypothetical protein
MEDAGMVPSAISEIVRMIAGTLSTSAGSAADCSAAAQFSAAEEDPFQSKSADSVNGLRTADVTGGTLNGGYYPAVPEYAVFSGFSRLWPDQKTGRWVFSFRHV